MTAARKFLLRSIYILTGTDFALTCIGIRSGYIVEANPFLAPLFHSAGIFGEILCAVCMFAPVFFLSALLTRFPVMEKIWVDKLIAGLTLIKAAVIGHHVALIQFYFAAIKNY